jgi:Mg2+ and Co2+ transporter CorA
LNSSVILGFVQYTLSLLVTNMSFVSRVARVARSVPSSVRSFSDAFKQRENAMENEFFIKQTKEQLMKLKQKVASTREMMAPQAASSSAKPSQEQLEAKRKQVEDELHAIEKMIDQLHKTGK